MPIVYPYTQYSGIWTMQQANAAISAGTWPVGYNTYSLYSWGNNVIGQLGLGNTTYYSSPKQVGSAYWRTGSTCDVFAGAIRSDGTLWTWGSNNAGNLGLGNTTNYSSPKQVGALTTWAKVFASRFSMLATKTDGTLWSWGSGLQGRLGLGNTTNYSSPKQVGALTTWLTITGGGYAIGSALAIKTDGTLWAWGYNINGQLGLGNTLTYSSPQQVGSLTNWLYVSGGYATYAIKTDGTLWAWGRGTRGQLGLGNSTNYSSPKQVGALTNWLKVTGGGYFGFAVAVKTDGTLWSWGSNNYGQLGLGNTTSYNSPKQIGALTTWLNVIGGGYAYALAVKNDGTLWAWGTNGAGQLGLGNTTSYSSPVQVGALKTWSPVLSIGQTNTLVLG